MELRAYQKTAISDVIRGFASNDRILLVMPTGSGKTVVASEICKILGPGIKVLWLAHQNELLMQAKEALLARKVNFKVCSAQRAHTLCSQYFDLVVIDEYHHEASATYQDALPRLGYKKLLGITATPRRHDKFSIQFDQKIVSITMDELAAEGHLAKVRLFRVRPRYGFLSDLVSWVNYHKNYVGKTIFFTLRLDDARCIKSKLEMCSGVFTGSIKTRDCLVEKFQAQNFANMCLISSLLLTEGVDFPMCKTVVLGRSTASATMMSQMIGRAMRMWPGKEYCNIVEAASFAENNSLRVESVIEPHEKYISTPSGISEWKTKKSCGRY